MVIGLCGFFLLVTCWHGLFMKSCINFINHSLLHLMKKWRDRTILKQCTILPSIFPWKCFYWHVTFAWIAKQQKTLQNDEKTITLYPLYNNYKNRSIYLNGIRCINLEKHGLIIANNMSGIFISWEYRIIYIYIYIIQIHISHTLTQNTLVYCPGYHAMCKMHKH